LGEKAKLSSPPMEKATSPLFLTKGKKGIYHPPSPLVLGKLLPFSSGI